MIYSFFCMFKMSHNEILHPVQMLQKHKKDAKTKIVLQKQKSDSHRKK